MEEGFKKTTRHTFVSIDRGTSLTGDHFREFESIRMPRSGNILALITKNLRTQNVSSIFSGSFSIR